MIHPTFNLASSFASHGYPLAHLQCQIHCIPPPYLPRTTSICPLITTYNLGLHSLRYILTESDHILFSDPSTHDLLLCHPSIKFCHPPNLCQLLFRTNLDPQPPRPIPGSYLCQKPRCNTCSMHPRSLSLSSLVTNLIYPIHTQATCSFSNFIYLLTCM